MSLRVRTGGTFLELLSDVLLLPQDYGGKGCMMGIDLAKVFEGPAAFKMLMGAKQCFSTALSVPFPAMGIAIQGDIAMSASPIKPCMRTSDCPTGFSCENGATKPVVDSGFDLFDLLFQGRTQFGDNSFSIDDIFGGDGDDDRCEVDRSVPGSPLIPLISRTSSLSNQQIGNNVPQWERLTT